MNLISNSVTPNDVVEEQRDGDRFLVVKDVPFIRPMELSGGYVPEKYVANTINAWAGEPLTANHPRNNQGKPVPARTKLNEVGVGKAENPYYDGTWGRVDLAINADRAEAMGGTAADIVEKIETGEKFDVSSQYLPKQLPSGEYDGKHRANVEGIRQPDSIALLPHKPGKCSLQDGCGINPQMAANSDIRVPMTSNNKHGEDMDAAAVSFDLTSVSPSEIDDWTDAEWDGSAATAAMPNPTESEGAAQVLDQSHVIVPTDDEARDNKSNWKLPFREGPDSPTNTRALVAIDAALSGARGGVEGVSDETQSDASEWVQEALQEAPDDLFGAMDGQTDNALSAIGRQVTEALGLTAASQSDSTQTTSAESGAEDGSTTTMDREKLIEEITANSALTENALEERCDDGLEAIHEDVMNANDDNQTANDDSEYVTKDELDEFRNDLVDELTANREQSEKEELATEIVANSAEYDETEDVMDDYPTVAALETKRDSLGVGGVMPGQGATANTDFGGEFDIDVSGGVLTE